jgi:uncharacterized 2Fe-2S/4Fe-4S cluster protein (DUF4445 family)
MTKFEITFLPENKSINVKENTSVLLAALSAGLDITGSCGGKGKCGKCKIRIIDNHPPPTKIETCLLSEEDLNNGFRLACMVKINNDLEIEVPIETRIANQKLLFQDNFEYLQGNLNNVISQISETIIKKVYIELPKPTLEDNISDFERVKRSLELIDKNYISENVKISLNLLKELPRAIRIGKWKLTLTLYKIQDFLEIINIKPGKPDNICYGISFDIGSTTIVGYLVDIENNKPITAISIVNPQVIFGDDILSRINYSIENKNGLSQLHDGIIAAMNMIIQRIIDEHGIKSTDIYEVVAVGNTCMHHLFLKLDPKGIATAPFIPSSNQTTYLKSQRLKIRINPEGYICTLPIVAGYLGSDAVAGALATNFDCNDSVKLLIDLGTNGEILLGSESRILGCSTAAGPAFEGGHIKHGSRAIDGAIDKVNINMNKFPEIEISTISNEVPVGITGSGLVDCVAELLKIGVIDRTGKFKNNKKKFHDRFIHNKYELEFTIVEGNATATGQPITITQQDIRELQLAKAAIRSGIHILVKELNVNINDITELFIAGAFGNYVNIENALIIKLIPEVPFPLIKHVGNAAGIGASLSLISEKERFRAEAIAESIEYIELANHQDFQQIYVDSMNF